MRNPYVVCCRCGCRCYAYACGVRVAPLPQSFRFFFYLPKSVAAMAATGATLPTPLRTPLLDAHEGETIVFEATLLREPFESSQRSSYLVLLGPLLQCMCYPCAKRQARKVADSWRFYVTEETLCFYLVQRNLYGCSFPQVSTLLVVKS